MEANSHEWNQFRAGKFTASENHKLMGEREGINSQTAKTYIYDKVAETLTGGWSDDIDTIATRWGKDMEPEAALYYELAFECRLDKVDPQNAEWSNCVSASPDRIAYPTIGKPYGIEIKSPYNPSNHVKYLLIKSAQDLKLNFKECYWQILTGLLVFKLPKWEFVSFDPRFKAEKRMHVLEIFPSIVKDDMNKLHSNLLLAESLKIKCLELIEL